MPVSRGLHPDEQAKLIGKHSRATIFFSRARAIALSAIRETYEEAGLLIATGPISRLARRAGRPFANMASSPDLTALRFVARAITPPGRYPPL